MGTPTSQPTPVAAGLGEVLLCACVTRAFPRSGWKGSIVVLSLVIGSPLLLTGQLQDQASTRSPHGNLSVPCQACHTNMSWKPIRAAPDFDHNKTSYPLRGMHASLAPVLSAIASWFLPSRNRSPALA
jgi:hypothetical protein